MRLSFCEVLIAREYSTLAESRTVHRMWFSHLPAKVVFSFAQWLKSLWEIPQVTP